MRHFKILLFLFLCSFSVYASSVKSFTVRGESLLLPFPRYSRIRGSVREELPCGFSPGAVFGFEKNWRYFSAGGSFDYFHFPRGKYNKVYSNDTNVENDYTFLRSPRTDILAFNASASGFYDINSFRLRLYLRTGFSLIILEDPEYLQKDSDPGWNLTGGATIGFFVSDSFEINAGGGYSRHIYFSDFPERFFSGFFVSAGVSWHF